MRTPEQLEKRRSQRREWYRNNRERSLMYQKVWVSKNRERKHLYLKAYYADNRERISATRKVEHVDLRMEIINIYGGYCVCCGETRPQFLTVDHIDSSGAAHRREIGSGTEFYKWLRRQGFPKDNFQLMCFNCNWSKGRYGFCPHVVERAICA